MSRPPTVAETPAVWSLITQKGIMRRAFFTALIVGTILNLIGQGDHLFAGREVAIWKILLTYCVPYCVATYGAVSARLESYKKADWQ